MVQAFQVKCVNVGDKDHGLGIAWMVQLINTNSLIPLKAEKQISEKVN